MALRLKKFTTVRRVDYFSDSAVYKRTVFTSTSSGSPFTAVRIMSKSCIYMERAQFLEGCRRRVR